jgi:glycosyltransferase A (GT-A) superfamily protein (DUF2064 family)
MQLVVLANEPRPEHMDGRLSPPWTLGQAAEIRMAALLDTLDTVAAVPASRRIVALDGEPGPWVPAGFDLVAQRSGSLANLLFGVFEDCFHVADEPVVLVGMETPQVDAGLLTSAQLQLETGADAVVGLTPAGGTWLLALRHLHPDAFAGAPASGNDTGTAQLERLRACGYQVALTEELRELGDAEDALVLAAQMPGTRLAAAVDAAVGATERALRRQQP